MNSLKFIVITGAALLLPSCNDVLGNLYDEPNTSSEYGFVKSCTNAEAGVIYINSSDFKMWTYIDFENNSIYTLPVDDTSSLRWDFAVHRYDTKTNNSKVIQTTLTDINQARVWEKDENTLEVGDILTSDKIITDLSTMLDGYVSYTDSYYNPELSKWLNLDINTMPPSYTLSGRVYIIIREDGERAAVKLSDFMNSDGAKGYMSIQYIYPLQDENKN